MVTAVSNWEERKEKDNGVFRLISLRRACCWLQMKASLKKNPLKCQIFQTKESEGRILVFSYI